MDKQKKENGKQWKNELYNGLLELAFAFVVPAAALGIVVLLPRELAQKFPTELLLLTACLLVVSVGGGLYAIFRWRKKKKAARGKEDSQK